MADSWFVEWELCDPILDRKVLPSGITPMADDEAEIVKA
jgi:hypothetical protein